MKVFISHSSRDKWVARKISEDLGRIGIETFLDEKDIETGESIDDSIDTHLKDCDEILILLSPSSLSSHWVLVEAGGARALGKRLVPILLQIGSNEIPSPLRKHLARDLNEIEKYYSEVRERSTGKKSDKPITSTKRKPTRSRKAQLVSKSEEFRVGDKVRISSSPNRNERADLGWTPEMKQYLGQMARIINVKKKARYVEVDIDKGEWGWAFEWISKE